MLHSVSRLEMLFGLHFLPFHFMDSKHPDCLQHTSFKTFQFKFLPPPPPLRSAQKHSNLQRPEFWYVTWLVMASLPPGQGKAWPLLQLFFPKWARLVLVLPSWLFTGAGSPQLRWNQEELLLLLFSPCKHLAVAIIMSLFKYLMQNLLMRSAAEITQHKLLIYSSLLKLSEANLN